MARIVQILSDTANTEKETLVPMRLENRVRAILIDSDNRLVLIRREKPGVPPYYVAPGGGVEPSDDSFHSALEREMNEELGGTITIHRLVYISEAMRGGDLRVRQLYYVCRLLKYNLDNRNGPEFNDPTRGKYIVERVALLPTALEKLRILSDDLKLFLIINAFQLFSLPEIQP
ncbi:MAG: NUDIX hydrolase [Anaerolineae bacterium]|nr:NUDIX hydrolase [Chloroflexota bacterium]MBP6298566.1 NUDIX hydrolase [Anaerolineae bacterium]